MITFFRGRRAVLLCIACAVGITLNGTRSAVAALALQQTYDGPPALSTYAYRAMVIRESETPTPTRYHCGGQQNYDTIERAVSSCEDGDTHEKIGGHHSNIWPILVGFAVVAAIAIIVNRTQFSHDPRPDEQALLEDGPQLPATYPDGSLSVRGFTRDGWPVVIDFEPQPGTVTQLEVTIGKGHNRHSEKIVLDPDGSHGRQLVKVILPQSGYAPVPTPAKYVITSVPIQAFDSDQPAASLAPVQIYGIGGGPRAVGSVAIEQVAFNRAMPGATFSYLAKSEFTKARAQVQRLQRTNGQNQIVPVFDDRKSNLSVGNQNGSWPGVAPTGSPSAYRLQVTGWFTTDDRSWVAAVAPGLIVE